MRVCLCVYGIYSQRRSRSRDQPFELHIFNFRLLLSSVGLVNAPHTPTRSCGYEVIYCWGLTHPLDLGPHGSRSESEHDLRPKRNQEFTEKFSADSRTGSQRSR